jgi:hypothetical protein
MKLFIAIIFILSSAFGFGQTAELSFSESQFQFPDTISGPTLSHDFHFTNKGKTPLVFTDYKVACTCTKVIFPKKPILPGQKGKLTVTFDTKGKQYWQNRIIEIYANSKKNPTKIRIKVYIN